MAHGKRLCLLLCGLVAGICSVGSPPAGAAGWLPHVDASPILQGAELWDFSIQDVAVHGEGAAVGAWIRATGGPEVLEVATRPAGGAWSGPLALSSPDEDATAPRVAVDPAGNAAVVWTGFRGGGVQVVRVATRPAGGAWSAPRALSDVEGSARAPDVAVDGDGDLVAIWCEQTGPNRDVVRTASRPLGGEWSSPVDLSDAELGAAWPQVAVDPQGNATALWVLWNVPGRSEGIVQSRGRLANGAWDPEPVDVSGAAGLSDRPRLAIDAQGGAVAVWQQRDRPEYNGYEQSVETARRSGGAWGAPETLSAAADFASAPTVAVDPAGNATALWLTSTPGNLVAVQTRGRAAAGSWGSPVNLSSRTAGLQPSESDLQLAADSLGNVTALWSAWSSPNMVVRSAHRGPGGAWGPSVTLSGAGHYALAPRVTVGPAGYALAVWSGYDGTRHAVRSGVFDAVGPELTDLAVPEEGVVGQPVTLSVAPFDVWSPPATASWDLGDGAQATGTTVEHCYSTPGTRTVVVTATDAVANAAGASRTIDIAPDLALPAGADPCSGSGPDPDPDPDPGPKSDPDPDGPGGPALPPIDSTVPRADPQQAHPGVARACARAKQAQRRSRTRVGQARRKQRAAAARTAKRRWRVAVRRREAALRKATAKVRRACR